MSVPVAPASVQDQPPIEVVSATVKLPPFWTRDPELWFHQAEAQFAIARIRGDRLRYDYVITSLSLDVIAKVSDVIQNPPPADLYQFLKEKLISRLSASEEQRLDALLSGSEIGDKKPSEFFRDLTAIVGDSAMVSPELLLKIWRRRLPKPLLIALTASGKVELNETLELADKIWASYNETQVATVAQQPNTTTEGVLTKVIDSINLMSQRFQDTLDRLSNNHLTQEARMQAMQLQLNAYEQRSTHRTQRSRSRGRSRSSSRQRDVCFYHERFGVQARKCGGPWCRFLASQSEQSKMLN